jgi:DNA polymerase-3 subunit delta'
MKFDNSLIGHALPQKILFQAIVSQKAGHAYLFSGEEGIGKRSVALAIAKSLLCMKSSPPSCGRCSSCLKSDQKSHPDLFEIAPDGAFIKISQVKRIQEEMGLQPALSLKKVFIIDEADRMNPEAANAFLKSLEEPPTDTSFFLITSRPQAILPTILSRCQQIRFSTPLQEELVKLLIRKRSLSEKEALHIAKRSLGKVGFALSLDLENLEVEDLAYFQLIQPENLESPERLFQLSEELSRDADHFRKTAEWLLSSIRDMIVWKSCSDSDYLILDRYWERIRDASNLFTPEQLNRSFAFLQKAERLIQRNMNRPLALETLLLHLQPRGGAALSARDLES